MNNISLGFLLLTILSHLFSNPAIGQSLENEYLLSAGDKIQIEVFQESDLSMELLLNSNGQFRYPYLGTLTAAGKTTKQLGEELQDKLRGDYLVSPEVHVTIQNYRNYFIDGEVNNPGSYPFQPGLTIRQAIVVAGGKTEWASNNRHRIRRENSTESERVDEDTAVKPGDTVTIGAGLF